MKEQIIGKSKIQLTDNNMLQLPLIDFLESIVENLEDDKLLEFITLVGLKDSLFKKITEMLAVNSSYPNYDTLYHEGREVFLEKIEKLAYKYYVKYIAELKEKINRQENIIRKQQEIIYMTQNNYQDTGDLMRFNWLKDHLSEISDLRFKTDFEEMKRLENLIGICAKSLNELEDKQ